MFGPAGDGSGVHDSVEKLCALAGVRLLIPSDVDALCCGTPWSSKGMASGYRIMGERVVTAVVAATRAGDLPLVCDASSCTEGLVKMLRESAPQVRVIDALTLIAERVLPGLADHPRLESLTLHPTCSSTQLGLNDALLAIARESPMTSPCRWTGAAAHSQATGACCTRSSPRRPPLTRPRRSASATRAPTPPATGPVSWR